MDILLHALTINPHASTTFARGTMPLEANYGDEKLIQLIRIGFIVQIIVVVLYILTAAATCGFHRQPTRSARHKIGFWGMAFLVLQCILIAQLTHVILKELHGLPSSFRTLACNAAALAVIGAMLSIISLTFIRHKLPQHLYSLALCISTHTLFYLFDTQQYLWISVTHLLVFFTGLCNEGKNIVETANQNEEPSLFARFLFLPMGQLFSHKDDDHLLRSLPRIPSDCIPEIAYAAVRSTFLEDSDELPGFWTLVLSKYRSQVARSAFFELLDIVCKFGQPFFLRAFLQRREPYIISVMFSISVINAIAISQASFTVTSMGAQLRSGLVSWIMEKTCDQIKPANSKVSIVNLVELDTQRIQDFVRYMHATWSAPLQVVICLSCISIVLGWQSAVAGIVATLLVYPAFWYCSNLLKRWQVEGMIRKDARLSYVSEVVHKVKTVKLLGLQNSVEAKVANLREWELGAARAFIRISALINVLLRSTPAGFSVAAFVAAQYFRHNLADSTLFPSLVFFALLTPPLAVLPSIAALWAGCSSSYERLQSFGCTTKPLPLSKFSDAPEIAAEPLVQLEYVKYSWDPMNSSAVKLNICLQARRGDLVLLTGQIGSGKSTLLSLVAGIIQPDLGHRLVSGVVAFMPQTPWLMAGSVRENILLGRRYDPARYNEVIRACALDRDLSLFSAGDGMLITSTGGGLSGGQKSRVAMARTLYSEASIFIFDDPLAALDDSVKSHICNQVFGRSGLLKNKIQIIVSSTNHIDELATSNFILINGSLLRSTVHTLQGRNRGSDPVAQHVIRSPVTNQVEKRVHVEEAVVQKTGLVSEIAELSNTELSESQVRNPSENVLFRWLHLAGLPQWSVIVAMNVLGYACSVYSTLVLRYISGDYAHTTKWLSVYSGATLLQAIVIYSWMIAAWHLLQNGTSSKLHAGLFKGVVSSSMEFFQLVPIGEITNRFTNDMSRCDTNMYAIMFGIINSAIRVIAAMFVLLICIPSSIFCIIPFLLICYVLQELFVKVVVPLKQLDTSVRGPLITNIQDVQSGAAIVHITGSRDFFRQRNYQNLYRSIQAYFCLFSVELWLTVRLNLLAAVLQGISAALLLYFDVDQGTAGLALSYLLLISSSICQTVTLRAQLEQEVVCVRRIFEYTDNAVEGAMQTTATDTKLPKDWPTNGHVQFIGYSASYTENTSLALREINLDLSPKQKVAVIGRTGAGKSTLASALLRLVEAKTGKILIDGIDIATIDLPTLRERISIIPQDLSVFSGSVRENLDPAASYADSTLLQVLAQCHFVDTFVDAKEALDFQIVGGGSNLSNGQLQLLAIAHALLTKSKVLILDEATASIDSETERLIHETLHEHCKNMTTITIAHRLKTITESDRIIVLDQGRVVESCSPADLVSRGGEFAQSLKAAKDGT